MSIDADLKSRLRYLLDQKIIRLDDEIETTPSPDRALKAKVKAVKLASKRLNDPTFGYCNSCWVLIPARDLLDEPERAHCSSCDAQKSKKSRYRSAS